MGRTRSLYKGMVWHYDLCCQLTESQTQLRALELIDLAKDAKVLDVAVGTGYILRELADLVSEGTVVAVDVSEHMLQVASDKSKDLENVHLHYASAYSLPYPDNTFDALINTYMMGFIPEQDFPKILAEFKRVLKPGGRLGVSALTHPKHWYNQGWTYVAKWFPAILGDCRPVELVPPVLAAGFKVTFDEFRSQSTYPSELVIAQKVEAD